MQKIAFLGLGVMGSGMAARLAAAGFPVTAWNRSAARADALRQRGAVIAGSPRQAAEDGDVIISMVADDTASRRVWTADDGALASVRADAIVIECSTVSPPWILELADLAAARGAAFLDAPVTGSRTHAAAGELVFLVGGDAVVLERARPVLASMGRDAVRLGPIGSGARMKLVNNFVCGVQAAALAEGLAFAEACGLEPSAALDVLANGAPGSPLVKAVSARMAARGYDVQFQLSLMRKDLAYAEAEALRHGVPLRTAAVARDLFDAAIQAGWGEADFAAVAEAVPGRRVGGASARRP
jgi:3-hydroxyisobutyrate dehydrogenase